MRSRAFAIFAAAVLLLNMVGFASADTRHPKGKKRQSDVLVALLPASDGVATVDLRRLFGEAMPQILSANQPLLAKIRAHIDELQAKTGLDLRKFDSLAIGVKMGKAADKKVDADPVAIARGDVHSGTLIAVAKLASNGAYREEKAGERTIYVFSVKDQVKTITPPAANGKTPAAVTGGIELASEEMALASLDDNTVVLGSPARVRETLEGKTHVSPEVTSLLSGRESSVITFAMRTFDGMSTLLPVENDDLGANVNSIKFLSGSMDVAAAGTSIQINAKTAKPEQARSLYDTLDGLKMVGKAFLGGSKRADQRIYARLIESIKIATHGTAVSLDLFISQADTDTLIAAIK